MIGFIKRAYSSIDRELRVKDIFVIFFAMLLITLLTKCSDSQSPSSNGGELIPCSSTIECPDEQICLGGVCSDKNTGNSVDKINCENDNDCLPNGYCVDGFCEGMSVNNNIGNSEQNSVKIEVSETVLEFGSIYVGDTVTRTIIIKSVGALDLNITEISFEGSTSNDFTCTPNILDNNDEFPIILEPTEEKEVSITYTPSDNVQDEGVLMIISNDQTTPVLRIPLTTEYKGRAMISVDPLLVDFGLVREGDTAEKIVTVKNAGSGNALLTVESIRPPVSVEFSIEADIEFPVLLNPEDQFEVKVFYTPVDIAPDEAMMLVRSDDPDQNTVTVQLKAQGLMGNADIEVIPAEFNFGHVEIGGLAVQSFQIINRGDGNMPLEINEIKWDPDEDPSFSFTVVEPIPSEIATGDSITLEVTFEPQEAADFNENILILNSDPDELNKFVPITATSLTPVIQVDPNPAIFGNLLLNQSETKTITIKNAGTGRLEISEVNLGDITSGDIQCSNCTLADASLYPLLLNENETATVDLIYTSTDNVRDNGSLLISSNDINSPVVSVPITTQYDGDAILVVDPVLVDFGLVPELTSSTRAVTIKNGGTGNSVLTVESVRLPLNPEFTMTTTSSFPIFLNPGQLITAEVTYSPMDGGQDFEVLLIGSDDANQPIVRVELTGTSLSGVPDIDVMPSSLDFGYIQIGNELTQSFRIVNAGTGNMPLNISDIRINSVSNTAFIIEPERNALTEVATGESMTVNVTFRPQVQDDYNESILITSSDSDEPVKSVSLIASSKEPPGDDVLSIEMSYELDHDDFLDTVDIRDVDLHFVSPNSMDCSKQNRNPNWDRFGNPLWQVRNSHHIPEVIIHENAGQEDGTYTIQAEYMEDCDDFLTEGSFGNMAVDELLEMLANDTIDVDLAGYCFLGMFDGRESINISTKVLINGQVAKTFDTRLGEKGDLVTITTIKRENGYYLLP